MDHLLEIVPPSAGTELLFRAQRYLTHREQHLPPGRDLEAGWEAFFAFCSDKISKYAAKCGAVGTDVDDCAQDVWRELLVRLPTFRLDSSRGRFETWLFQIVRSKAIDLCRARQRTASNGNADAVQIADHNSDHGSTFEESELMGQVWDRLRHKLSDCTYQVLQMRLVQRRSVAEVAKTLGLTSEQVWYRYHRALRHLQAIGTRCFDGRSASDSGGASSRGNDDRHDGISSRRLAKNKSGATVVGMSPEAVSQIVEDRMKNENFAPGPVATPVSLRVRPGSQQWRGSTMDYVFQTLELGRRELIPEWKVEWICDTVPQPVLYIRKSAIVAYAEMCGPEDFIATHWPRIVNAALAAGVAAGIATIIATPTAALPIFQTEFHKQLQSKGSLALDESVRVALSARQEPNGPWCACRQ